MVEMDWFYNETNYPSILDDFYEKKRYRHFYDKHEISAQAKTKAYKKWKKDNKNTGKTIPKIVADKYKK